MEYYRVTLLDKNLKTIWMSVEVLASNVVEARKKATKLIEQCRIK